MNTGAAPLFGTITWLDSRQTDRDPASHGAELAMELQIAQKTGELPSAANADGAGGWSTAWGWLYSLPFVRPRR
jgi:hypothetical protein